ncbi:MAG: SLBB domain-containing protein [candidate division KSB1 bacterium]|nr:SLBB domain-containing protein [candidate division KSB1 bacterium]MDZ7365424.1 SLBB domain-containing protein [candidate division KSB1 bacterium]MDZ7403529.1 SLBB domain-containing protein [candidate division KSB1 bacterium]
MRKFIVVSIVIFSPLVQPSFAQTPKEKNAEPNRYLNPGSFETFDLLQDFYQQQARQQDKKNSPRSNAGSQDPAKLLTQIPGTFPLEGPIDPAEYIVGPSDVLAVTIGGVAPFSHTAAVTPEGTFVIPLVGEVTVAGSTLLEVKKDVRNVMRKRYKTAEVGVHLLALRTFKVSVVGAVTNPGAYTVTPVDRVDYVVGLANRNESDVNATAETPAVSFKPATKSPLPISRRNIKLFRVKSDTINIDLVRYQTTGDTRYNPYLRDGDVIFVPAENLPGNSVGIYGGVRQPGVFEFHPGDSLQALLRMAQGPTALANLEHVEIVRFLPDGRQQEIIHFNLKAGQNGHTPDMALQRNDRVFIRENPELRKERMIRISGAVARPGEYALVHERNMLSEMIERAGGFNADASIAESKVIRTYKNPDAQLKNPDYARLLEMRLTDLKTEDRDYFNYEAALKRGFVAVDFARLFNHHDKAADVEVWDGDEIYVPTLRQTINVFGQVINPGYVTFVEGMETRYYIEKAGGFSATADHNKVRILKRETNAWLKPGEAKLEPGDQIFVSRKMPRPASTYFNAVRDILQTTASLATVYLLYRQVTK